MCSQVVIVVIEIDPVEFVWSQVQVLRNADEEILVAINGQNWSVYDVSRVRAHSDELANFAQISGANRPGIA